MLSVFFNTFLHADAFWCLCIRLWKHRDKKRNCSKQAISPFDTIFSITFNKSSFREIFHFPYYCWDVFKVVVCRFVVCGKGLNHCLRIYCMFSTVLTTLSFFLNKYIWISRWWKSRKISTRNDKQNCNVFWSVYIHSGLDCLPK